MASTKPRSAQRAATSQDLPIEARLAHEHSMAVLMSTATFEILEEDGKNTDRLIYLGKEYSRKFIASHGLAA